MAREPCVRNELVVQALRHATLSSRPEPMYNVGLDAKVRGAQDNTWFQ
jgi:hypothetical protein